MTVKPPHRLFVAVDTPDLDAALAMTDGLKGAAGLGIKLGLEFFGAHGPAGVKAVTERVGAGTIFLDLKFHDIPNTVAGAIRAVVPLAPAVVNVHASGGPTMMRAAAAAATEAAAKAGVARPAVLAVTVLTSMDESDLSAVGQTGAPEEQVVRLAKLAQECGMDGVVCSAREIAPIRAACGADFLLVVPGIRPAGSQVGDQKRVLTPAEAVKAGASSLVVGRPITQAAEPRQAAAAILEEANAAAQ